MDAQEWWSDITGGKLVQRVRDEIANALRQLDGKRVRLRIDVVKPQRSARQNSYYWACIVEAARRGMAAQWQRRLQDVEPDDVHKWLSAQCNGSEIANESSGEITRVPHSTKKHDTAEANAYHDRCRATIQDWFKTSVPLPNTKFADDMIDAFNNRTM